MGDIASNRTHEVSHGSLENEGALSALLFLYRHAIGREVGDLGEVIRRHMRAQNQDSAPYADQSNHCYTAMYALYSRQQADAQIQYAYLKEVSVFGCNVGYVPKFVRANLPTGQAEPYHWHVPMHEELAKSGEPNTALVIDINPYSKNSTYVTLCEIYDVWGLSDSGWTPALAHLRVILEHDTSTGIDKKSFTVDSAKQLPPVYSIWYFAGTVANGDLDGKWIPPGPSSTNSALLWPSAMKYFMSCIAEKSPELLSSDLRAV